MERDLVELFEAAKKAADAATADDGGAEESRCLDALGQLKNFPVSYQLLVSTQVGKRLRPLTKHPRKKIQTFASKLIDIWKDIVIKETSKEINNGKSEEKIFIKVESPRSGLAKSEKLQRNSSVKVEKAYQTENVKVQKVEKTPAHNVKVEKVSMEVKRPGNCTSGPTKLTSMIKCNDFSRDKMREIICEALSKVSGEANDDTIDEVNACDPIRVAVTVESVLFENWGCATGAQKVKYRSLMFNLKDLKNPDFRRRVLLGHVQPERLVSMSTLEMASDKRRQENTKLEQKALFECERGGAPKATTDQFKCGRCGHRKTTYHQMQTRSADEPMTTYVTCVNCNNHWKFC